jgi:hypothetical protein
VTRALLHIMKILLAYALAALAAGYAVDAALLVVPSGGVGQDAGAGGITFGLMVTFFVGLFAALPASLVVSIGEYKSWRMWWYYAIAGALIGYVLGKLFSPPLWFPWFGLGFGPVSGLVFWAIAGRSAGHPEKGARNLIAALFLCLAVILLLSSWSVYFGVPF